MKTLHFASVLSVCLTTAFCVPAEPAITNGLLLNFHQVPLRAVLEYLSDQAGLIVVSEADVQGTVTLTAAQPISITEAVGLLNNQLSRNKYAAVLDGRTLTVMSAARAATDASTPVVAPTNPAAIPVNNQIVTEILPVHTLNPTQLLTDLERLIPDGDTVSADEAGSAVIMTASQKDIRRIAAIINALDSTAISEVSVFPLAYADAKAVADELKQLFQSADSDINRAGQRMSFAPRFGLPGGDGGGNPKDKTAPTKAVFVADEQMNAVAASAPPDYMPMIARVIELLDKPGEDVTTVEIFILKHADPGEIVLEINDLFASAATSVSADQPVRGMGFQFGGPGLASSAARTATPSTRAKRQATVTAVADRRTQSVIVTAAETAMAQIRKIVDKLDQGSLGVAKLSVIQIDYADAGIVNDTLAALLASNGNKPGASSQTPTALIQREIQAANQMTPSTATGTTGGGSPGLSH